MDSRKETIENILSELNGRSGFDDWWHNISEDIQDEIIETLVDLLPTQEAPLIIHQSFCSEMVRIAKENGKKPLGEIPEAMQVIEAITVLERLYPQLNPVS